MVHRADISASGCGGIRYATDIGGEEESVA